MIEVPFISVIVTCRNEEKFISRCLDSIIANDYPKAKREILVVDGMSTDTSREIVNAYAVHDPNIRLIDNVKRVFPSAVNRGIEQAKGEFVVIMGAHATYAQDYLSMCIQFQAEFQADNVGGTSIPEVQDGSGLGKAIALSRSHPFGAGNATYRTGSRKPKWVDTVFGGCYSKKTFERIGLFDESLVRSSDMDFNVRLKRAGGRILMVPDIVTHYYPGSGVGHLWGHNFIDGVWATYPLAFGSTMFRIRHLVPLMFISGLLVSGLLALVLPIFFWVLVAIVSAYLLANLVSAGHIALTKGVGTYLMLLPLVFFVRHAAYGLGSLVGLGKVLASRQWLGRPHQDKDGGGSS